MDIVERLRGKPMVMNENGYTSISVMGGAMLNEAADEIERLRAGFVWLDDTIEGHLLLNPEDKDSKLIQEIKRKISFILSNGEE